MQGAPRCISPTLTSLPPESLSLSLSQQCGKKDWDLYSKLNRFSVFISFPCSNTSKLHNNSYQASLGGRKYLQMRKKEKKESRVRLFATPCGITHQAPLSMGFSRQEYWSGSSFPSPGNLPNPGIEPRSPALQVDSLSSEPIREAPKGTK